MRPNLSKVNPLKALREAIEALEGLTQQLTPSEAVDLEARLRANVKLLKGVSDTLSDIIQTHLKTNNLPGLDGDLYHVSLSLTERVSLDTAKVKAFLGKRLGNYQVTSSVSQLLFKPKA